jgi:hypothetical protein
VEKMWLLCTFWELFHVSSRETTPNKCTPTTSSPRVFCNTTSAVHHRRFRFYTILLIMGMMMPETCWDTNHLLHLVGYLFTFMIQAALSHEIKICCYLFPNMHAVTSRKTFILIFAVMRISRVTHRSITCVK